MAGRALSAARKRKTGIRLGDLVAGLSSALDLVSPSLVRHHRQVLGLAAKIADAVGPGKVDGGDVRIAAALHDVGAVAFEWGADLRLDDARANDHAELGYRILKQFPPFAGAAELVLSHHCDCDLRRGCCKGRDSRQVLGSGIIRLADRIALLLDNEGCLAEQAEQARSFALKESGRKFAPEAVEAFLQISAADSFWLDARYCEEIEAAGRLSKGNCDVSLDTAGLLSLSELFRMIIDFRNGHTASHSLSVARIAEAVGRLAGFDAEACGGIRVAGNLHDVGKLAVPAAILDKPGLLDRKEISVVRSHPYHSHRILRGIAGLDDICTWASLHHENLDGSGYPFCLAGDRIPLEARIVAAADVFAALSESRPYRDAMGREECLGTLNASSKQQKLDADMVGLVADHYPELLDLMHGAHRDGISQYKGIVQDALPFISEPERLKTEAAELSI